MSGIYFQSAIDLVTVFDAILTSRQTREKLQCLYENVMSNNFRKTAVLQKISIVNFKSSIVLRALHDIVYLTVS